MSAHQTTAFRARWISDLRRGARLKSVGHARDRDQRNGTNRVAQVKTAPALGVWDFPHADLRSAYYPTRAQRAQLCDGKGDAAQVGYHSIAPSLNFGAPDLQQRQPISIFKTNRTPAAPISEVERMPPRIPSIQPLRATHRASIMGTQVAVAAAVAGIGAYTWYLRSSSSATASDKPPVFSSFGFHTLRLHSTELINHNTKKLRFELPDATKPSGLSLTSALLTIAIPKGRWLPVLRPYTPVNDLSAKAPCAFPSGT